MGIKSQVGLFLVVFAVTFAANAIVTYLYGMIVYSQGSVDWLSAVPAGIFVGIPITWVIARQEKKQVD